MADKVYMGKKPDRDSFERLVRGCNAPVGWGTLEGDYWGPERTHAKKRPHIHLHGASAGFPTGSDHPITYAGGFQDEAMGHWIRDGCKKVAGETVTSALDLDCVQVMGCVKKGLGGESIGESLAEGVRMRRAAEGDAGPARTGAEGTSRTPGKGAKPGKSVRGGPCPTCGGGGGGGAGKPCTCKPGGEAETKKPVNSKPKEGEGTSRTPGKGPKPGKSVRGGSCRTCGGGGGGGAPDCTCTKSNKSSTVAAAAAPAPLLTKRLDLSIKSKGGYLAYELPKGAYEGVTTTHDPAMLVVPTANTLQREKNAPGVLIQEPTKEFIFRKKEGKLVITEKGTKGEVTWELLERTKKRKSRRRGTGRGTRRSQGTRKGTRRGTRRGTRKGTRRATRNRTNRTNTRKRA
jgi:hypothetical protein